MYINNYLFRFREFQNFSLFLIATNSVHLRSKKQIRNEMFIEKGFDESGKIFLTKIKEYLQRGVVQRRLNLVRHRQHHRVLREFIHRLFRA